MERYQAIIPAAGIGTRLKPHTHTLPKALLSVAGKPILGYILDDVAALGIRKVTVVTGFFAEKVEEYVRRAHPELDCVFARQTEQLGLGHAVWTALNENAERRGLASLIILGDTIVEADLAGMFAREESVICVAPTENPRRFGIVSLEGERISGMVEKPQDPPTNLAIVGIYLIRDSELLYQQLGGNISDGVRTRGEFQLTDALAAMLAAGTPFAPWRIERWFDCGKPETLLATNRALLDRDPPPTGDFDSCVIIPPVFIAADVELRGSVIGPYASIDTGARITDSIVRDSLVGRGAELTGVQLDQSLVGLGARVTGAFSTINAGDDSIISLG
jgi:glucose-1-phosphate thymidylyltransferase